MNTVNVSLSKTEIREKYFSPLLKLVREASEIHKQFHHQNKVQISRLVSIKTGGCPEDCAYCPQAARYQTDVDVHKLMPLEEVIKSANEAKLAGASRMCMGASWREVRDNSDFDRVIEMVRMVNEMGMEVCCTLGMLTAEQAEKLAAVGLYAYNHNLDTSEDYYGEIISTRKYDDRLETIENVRKANLTVCSGGIIGLGETHDDRISMLHTLSNLDPIPESVPINTLVAVEGTPLENQKRVPFDDVVRMVATARILMPTSMIRLSAGRDQMSFSEQAMCFLAGANSFFSGDKLLTTSNPSDSEDKKMLERLGLEPLKPHEKSSG